MIAVLEKSKKMKKKSVRVVVYMTEEMKERLDRLAEKRQVPISNLMTMWASEKLEEEENK